MVSHITFKGEILGDGMEIMNMQLIGKMEDMINILGKSAKLDGRETHRTIQTNLNPKGQISWAYQYHLRNKHLLE